MKRKSIFGKKLTFLIVGVLAVLAFIRGTEQTWALAGVFAVFTVWLLVDVLRTGLPRIRKSLAKKRTARENKRIIARPQGSNLSESGGPVETALLLHVNCRISEYLKSAYPEVTWEWVSQNPEKLAAENGAGRIKLFGIPDFNFADVMFDRFARLECDMLRIVPFAELRGKSEPDAVKPRGDMTVNPEAWYTIQGKKTLEACVTKLNSNGHASLIIKENGDICVLQEETETVRDTFKNLPGKGVWDALVRVIENKNSGLTASVTGDCIKVSW
jgi:hypothetical protein